MKISDLSYNFRVKELNKENIEEILTLYHTNPIYFEYCPPFPNEQSIQGDLINKPQNVSINNKHFVGFYDGNQLMAILDLIESYPDNSSCWIGLFMVDGNYQGKNIGSFLIERLCKYIYSKGYQSIKLAYVQKNIQARNFWLKNQFKATGSISEQSNYTVAIMERLLS